MAEEPKLRLNMEDLEEETQGGEDPDLAKDQTLASLVTLASQVNQVNQERCMIGDQDHGNLAMVEDASQFQKENMLCQNQNSIKSTTMWLYPSRSTGTLAPRTSISQKTSWKCPASQ